MKKISKVILFLVIITFVIGIINYSLFSLPHYCNCEAGYYEIQRNCEYFCDQYYHDDCLWWFPLNYDGLCDYYTNECIFTYKYVCAKGGSLYRTWETYCWQCED